jgi:hypothetical protein
MVHREAKIHSGRYVRPYGERIFCMNMDLLIGVTKIIIPDIAKGSVARFGVHRTGRPHAVGMILAVGPDVKNENLQRGKFIVIDALNSHPKVLDGKTYLFPREIAVLCMVDAEDVVQSLEDRERFGKLANYVRG